MAGEAEPLAPVTVAGAPQEPAASASPDAAAPAATPEAPPVVAPEPTVPAVVEPAALVVPAAELTLLEKFDLENAPKPAEPAKPADSAKPSEVKPAEPAKPVAEPAKPVEAAKPGEPVAPVAPEPVAYEYALPETIRLDDATKATFHTALDAFRADPNKGAQGLIDLHNQTMQQYADGLAAEQMKVWNDTRRGWQTEVMADEELGGAGYNTTMGAIARMRDMFVPEGRKAEFESFVKVTGAGDHPAFLRLMHNLARVFDEAPMPPPGPRPPPDIGKAPGTGRIRDMYKTNRAQ